MSSLMTMQAAVSSVNCGLNVKPSLLKNAIERLRSFTGRFTKILVAISAPSKGWIGDSLRRGEFLCPAAPPRRRSGRLCGRWRRRRRVAPRRQGEDACRPVAQVRVVAEREIPLRSVDERRDDT